MQVLYKTRANEYPKGKPNVYFTCHPSDFDVYFADISTDILLRKDVAIWYKDDMNSNFSSQEEKEIELSRMQLFIVPVTTNLLMRDNYAIEQEIPFAEKYHIPILALMMEEGLDQLFQKKFHDIQYLCPKQQDPTAISYDIKLNKFLDSTLIGSEVAEKVRQAFDAYVFLSYRKKDRSHAIRLMQMIHSTPDMQSFAIWYDEYLVPGENFREAILNALEKSSLFALVVTPNIIENGNYVENVEYPLAKGKSGHYPIVPFEMEKTDINELEKHFSGIPTPVSIDDELGFKEVLAQNLSVLAKRENEGSVEHRFLIGMAYLYGIDVEVDFDRASKLITNAAESGLLAAISQLIIMYNEGYGIKRNYYKAVKWREKEVRLLRSEGKRNLLADSLNNLAHEYYEIGKVEKAQDTLLELISIYQEDNRIEELVSAYKYLGDMSKAQGKYAESDSLYDKALLFAESASDGSISVRRQIANIIMSKSIAVKYQNKDPQELMEHATRVSEQLYSETCEIQDAYRLSYCYNQFGEINTELGKIKIGKDFFLKALEIRKKLFEETGDDDIEASIGSSYSYLGGIALEEENFDEAQSWYEKRYAIAAKLEKRISSLYRLKSLHLAQGDLAKVAGARGDYEEALAWQRKNLVICKKLEKSGIVDDQLATVLTLTEIGNLCADDSVEAIRLYQQAAKKCKSIASEEVDIERIKTMLATLYLAIGVKSYQINETKDAIENLQKCLDVIKEIKDWSFSKKKNVEYKLFVEMAMSLFGDIIRDNQDLNQAEHVYLSICEDLADYSDDYNVKETLAATYMRLGSNAIVQGKLTEAEIWYTRRLELVTERVTIDNSIGNKRQLADAIYGMGWAFECNKKHQEALKWYYQGLNIAEGLIKDLREDNDCKTLGMYYNRIANVEEILNGLDRSIEWYEKSIKILEQIDDISDVRMLKLIAFMYDKLGLFYSERNENISNEYYVDCMAVLELINEREKSLQSNRKLAKYYQKIGEIKERQDLPNEAVQLYKKSVTTYQFILKSENIEDMKDLLYVYECLSNVLFNAQDNKQALKWCQKALLLAEKIYETTNSDDDKYALQVCKQNYNTITNIENNLFAHNEQTPSSELS